MAVSEDIEIVVLRPLHFAAIYPEIFVVERFKAFAAVEIRNPASPRPCMRDIHAEIGMDTREKPLTYTAVEKPLEHFVSMVAGPQPVTMTDKESLTAYLKKDGFAVDRDAKFLREVVEHPHVVVTGEEYDGDSCVAEFSQFSQKSGEAPGDCVAILEPEIEDVAEKIDRMGIMADLFKPADDSLLPCDTGGMIGDAQVKIGGKVYFLLLEGVNPRNGHVVRNLW